MKRLLYKSLLPFLLKAAYPIAKCYWFIVRPTSFGAKVLIEHNNNYLLIRHTYGPTHWSLPGGGVRRGETPDAAAKRETIEETGIEISHLRHIGTFESTREYKHDTIHCFHASALSDQLTIDPIEIIEARWFPKDALPTLQSRVLRETLVFRNGL